MLPSQEHGRTASLPRKGDASRRGRIFGALTLTAAIIGTLALPVHGEEGCRNIYALSTERYVKRDSAAISYRADSRNAGADERFYFKRCDRNNPNRFIIYDPCQNYLSSDSAGLVFKAAVPDTWGEWELVPQGDSAYALRSVAHGRWLEAMPFLFVVRTASSLNAEGHFRLSSAEGCPVPPEAIIGAFVTNTPQSTTGLLWGFADIHSHAFANLGFGGKAFWGAPFSRFGLENALRSCDCLSQGVVPCFDNSQVSCLISNVTHCGSGNFIECLRNALSQCLLTPDQARCVQDGVGDCELSNLGPCFLEVLQRCQLLTNMIHGPGGMLDLAGNTYGGGSPLAGHDVEGYPSFRGWPKWSSVNHQQMYYKWMERAYLGGMRLLVIHAVNNEALPARYLTGTLFSGEDMDAVDLQIEAVNELQQFIDWQSGGTGQGWFRIAESPQEARQIIADGKMAVVLGIEVSSLFGCRLTNNCTRADVSARLTHYYQKGVRQVFLVHHYENLFGGPAFLEPFLNVGNRIVNGNWFADVVHCEPETEFNLNEEKFEDRALLFATALLFTGDPLFPTPVPPGHCDGIGLTDLGRYAMSEMMRLNMIFDVDHLSWEGAAETLDIVESQNYPVVASHATFYDLVDRAADGHRNERSRRADEIQRIRNLGGLVAPIVSVENVITYSNRLLSTCNTSSWSVAQAYLYTVDHMRGGPYLHAVPVGTDLSGFATHPKPRFETNGCNDPENTRVQYPFPVHHRVGTGYFSNLQTGTKIYDYNVDGFANVGLWPDFIQDLKNIGVTDAELDPLFRSAEAYIQMWERIESRPVLAIIFSSGPPGTVTLCWPLGASGYTLECSPTLGSSAAWAPVTNPLTTNGTRLSITLPASAASSFYRLHRL